ncbi:hypothetical protein EDD18DRAFT_1362087 [Armillaria luteobubalina]|uniref:Uncharacterized protein n=1 Tax=Armillaria luteobubalina TaxID=153913 RepID=A0AA39TE59_9AGAR|nr:hypothetical protein EDD18DRAFT_1362087 [Armillaria luteobubalina]
MAHNQPSPRLSVAITPQETGALLVDNPLFTFRHSTLVTAHNQTSPSSEAITPQETGALRGDRVSRNNLSTLGSLDDQVSGPPSSPPTSAGDSTMPTLRLSRNREPEDPPAPKIRLIGAHHLPGQNILRREAVEGRPLEANVDADVDMDYESQMIEQILQFEGQNLNLKAINESYLKRLREQDHFINQQNDTIKDERESFQRKFDSLEASMNEKMASMRSEQARLERGLIEKSNSVLALRSSLAATSSNRSKTRTVAVKAHHINLPIINFAPDSSEASSRAASASELTSTIVAVSAGQEPISIPGRIQTPIPVLVTGQTHTVGAPPPVFAMPTPPIERPPPVTTMAASASELTSTSVAVSAGQEPITRLTRPAVPTIAPASIPGRIQTPIPVLVTGQTRTVGAPPPVFATPTPPTERPPPVTMATSTSSSVPAVQQSNPVLNASLPAPAHPLPDQLEGINFSNPDIPSSAVINALTLLMDAMKTGKPSVEGRRVSRRPGTRDYWLQVKRAGKIQLTHGKTLRYNALVWEVWREVFDVERLNDFISYTPADPEEVVSYNLDDGDRPGERFTLDFSEGWRRSNWNTTILNKIAIKVKNTNESNHDWNLPFVSDEYISALLWNQLEQCQGYYQKSLAKWISSSDRFESPTEIAARVGVAVEQEYHGKRIRAAQTRKFQRRTGVVTNIIALKTESDAPDLQYWNLLKKILEQLGRHGMSPEESGTQMDNGVTMQVFIVQLCKWRAPEITEYLKLIDDMGKLPALQGRKASRPSNRVHSSTDCDIRAPPGLPRAMYNDAWLKDLSRASIEELQISEEAFDFLNIAVQNL